MFRIIVFIFLLGYSALLVSQNPHGTDMKISCNACHNSAGWGIEAEYWQKLDVTRKVVSRTLGVEMKQDTFRFHHGKTNFELRGQHAIIDCKACHSNLVFSEASSECISCHQDIHQQSVGTDCARCHNSSNWAVNDITELHIKNGFPLNGVHKTVNCNECHTSASTLEFNPIGNDCVNCHLNDFNETAHPNHKQAGFSTDCKQCHDIFKPGWPTDKVKHDFFPLTKSHDLDCAKCHNGPDYSNTPSNCYACHQPDFEATLNPNHIGANFSNYCAQCHTTDPDWMPANYLAHDGDYFPIYTGKHKGQWTECKDCHLNSSNYKEFTCTNCHINPETDNGHKNVNGYVYENTACISCHPTGNTENVFDHNTTNFPLTGAHNSLECKLCHSNGFAGTPTNCSACHTIDYENAKNPNHVNLSLSTDCASCHTTQPGWEPANFPDHNKVYALNGAHSIIATNCVLCHKGDYNNTPNTCNGCHKPDYDATTNPNHVTANFPVDCATCHTETGWSPANFDHSKIYPLTGAHEAITDCNACHKGNYNNTPNNCKDCHNADYNQTLNPNHVLLIIPDDCAACHTTQPGWQPAKFDIHDKYYVIKGAHLNIASDCAQCHKGDYNNTPNTCNECHNSDYASTTNPNHTSAQFPVTCENCHSESAWQPANFDHDGQYFPIYSGKHKGEWTQCIDCHANPSNYTEITCTNCHINPQTDNDHSGVGGYSYNSSVCLACHPTGEANNIFDHNSTKFLLTGGHSSVNCIDCHMSGFKGTPTNCNACHMSDFNATVSPNHSASKFPVTCETCHTVNGWKPSTFDHNVFYPFNGAHASISNDCNACHNGNYNNTPNTCVGCHTPDYNGTTNPNHALAQFPTTCETCHNESGWSPSTFDHSVYYPFNGAHASISNDCNACHNGNYNNTPNTCAGCHTPDYNATTNPNHTSAQFPTTCETCHNESGWVPSTFDHNVFYPLNGAHASIANDCNICHNGNYNNTPNTCYGCHSADYNSTTDPNHTVVQFPTECASCHNESAWVPGNFNHDGQYFPIYSGTHNGQWTQCLDCHNNPSNYTEVTCITCHINPETNDEHNGVGGYSYNSPACLACHPTGEAGNAFNHNNSAFPLTGAHIMVDCIECHANGYAGTPTNCAACHITDYNQSTNPDHTALNFSDNCLNCHTTAPDWKPALFPNHNDYYALNGAHALIANDCNACHNGNYNNTPNTCYECHIADYNATSNPDHSAGQLPTTCTDCHSETAWVPSTFNHNVYYPLTGAHSAIANDCNACHNGNYNNTPNTCAGCHTPDYNSASNPNHNTLGLPTDCAQCHTTDPGWQPATFPIHNNFWPLNGAHAGISSNCVVCHNGNYNNTPNTCYGCHAPDYNSATDPNHASNQFPTNCASCHSETAWVPSTFNHNNYYPLTGAHLSIANDCNACHNGNYNNTPNTCAGCHTPDYNTSTNPNHLTLNIPTNCAMCHTTAPDWQPATFPIHNNYWPLVGAHLSIANDCDACHNGNYNNTPNTCFGCHSADYNGATNPNHAAAQFPTTCQDCHSQSAWEPANFNHDQMYFPIYSGKHDDEWNQCIDCHINPNDYSVFSCTICHDNQNELADEHETVPGYVWSSPACYACHPDGED